MRAQVKKMADLMEQRLTEHDADRGPEGWLGEYESSLIDSLEAHVDELVIASDDEDGKEKVWQAAADVANFAMMIADLYEVQYG